MNTTKNWNSKRCSAMCRDAFTNGCIISQVISSYQPFFLSHVVWRPEPHYNPWNPNNNLNRSLIKSLNKPTKTFNMPLNMPLNISLHHSLINISQHLSTKNPATTDLSTYHLSTYHQGCRGSSGACCKPRIYSPTTQSSWQHLPIKSIHQHYGRNTKTVHSSVPTLTLLGLQILISPMSNWTLVAVKDTLRIKICTIVLYRIVLYCTVLYCIVLYG